jgi:hypothetical protein
VIVIIPIAAGMRMTIKRKGFLRLCFPGHWKWIDWQFDRRLWDDRFSVPLSMRFTIDP